MKKKNFKIRYWAYTGNSLNGQDCDRADDESADLAVALGVGKDTDAFASLFTLGKGESVTFQNGRTATFVRQRQWDHSSFGHEQEIVFRVE